ncbi:MAG: urease accessory protein UreD [Burkholderiales bacterium]|nr:urease accessory protein UreD [Burkholderiales bacterium]
MPWHAQLRLDYSVEAGRTVARHTHSGPLRILQSLYPEGDSVCHNVLVHPPGGLVGGDTLDVNVHAQAGSHALITTPGATRFYRSDGLPACQNTRLQVDAGARLEWLPLEALCYSGCIAENHLTLDLAPGAELMGWDVTALGLPHANQPFLLGSLRQHMELPGVWLERGAVRASDTRLLDSPVGLAGLRCMASLFFVTGTPLTRERRLLALEGAREHIATHALAATAGATSPQAQVIVVRVLAPVVEPAMELLRTLRNTWRQRLWSKSASSPRIWSM